MNHEEDLAVKLDFVRNSPPTMEGPSVASSIASRRASNIARRESERAERRSSLAAADNRARRSLQYKDEVLLRALDGDAEAADALQRRQAERRAKRLADERASALAPRWDERNDVAPAPTATSAVAAPPRDASHSLLREALDGAATWLNTPRSLGGLLRPTPPAAAPTHAGLTMQLHAKAREESELKARERQLSVDLRAQAASVDEMRAQLAACQSALRQASAPTRRGS